MRVRFVCLALGMLLVPALAHADSHNADFYGGFAGGGGGSTIPGFITEVAKDFKEKDLAPLVQGQKEHFHAFWAGVGGVSSQFGSHEGRQLTRTVYGAGGRMTITKHDSRNFYHAQAQLVGIYSNDGLDHEQPNDLGIAVGAAYDFSFHGPRDTGSVGTKVYGMGLRFQADRIFNIGSNGDVRGSVWRLSAGLIYRAPRK